MTERGDSRVGYPRRLSDKQSRLNLEDEGTRQVGGLLGRLGLG